MSTPPVAPPDTSAVLSHARARPRPRAPGDQPGWLNPWLAAVLVAALVLAELPLVLAACCAPSGATGLGTVWFVSDFAQYESAMRQGAAHPGWLISDPFTTEAHQPTLMFPLYVGLGKLAAATQLSADALERLTEVAARTALVLAVWYAARRFTSSLQAARWALALTLFGSGFELIAAAVGGYTGNWSYETNGFGLLFAAPHVPLAMAATLALAARTLLPIPGGPTPTRHSHAAELAATSFRQPTATDLPLTAPATTFHQPTATEVPLATPAMSFRQPTATEVPLATPATSFRQPTAPGLPLATPAWSRRLSATQPMWLRSGGWRALLVEVVLAAALSAAIALLHPFHLPVLLAAMLLSGLVFWSTRRGVANLVVAVVATLAALPILAPTIATFSFDPFWLQTYSSQNQVPSPMPHELVVDLGATLLLALAGAWLLRGRVAPFGLIVWVLLGCIAMYLPVPYQRRLAFGIQPALAMLAANALVAWCAALDVRRAALVRLGVVAAAASGTTFIVASVVASGFGNAPLAVYRSTRDLDAAATWLDGAVQPEDIIMADWQTANYLAPRTPGKAFGGHPVATLRADQKQFLMASVFAHPSSGAVARSLGARWLVYGPAEAQLLTQGTPAFQSGDVRVFRLGSE